MIATSRSTLHGTRTFTRTVLLRLWNTLVTSTHQIIRAVYRETLSNSRQASNCVTSEQRGRATLAREFQRVETHLTALRDLSTVRDNGPRADLASVSMSLSNIFGSVQTVMDGGCKPPAFGRCGFDSYHSHRWPERIWCNGEHVGAS